MIFPMIDGNNSPRFDNIIRIGQQNIDIIAPRLISRQAQIPQRKLISNNTFAGMGSKHTLLLQKPTKYPPCLPIFDTIFRGAHDHKTFIAAGTQAVGQLAQVVNVYLGQLVYLVCQALKESTVGQVGGALVAQVFVERNGFYVLGLHYYYLYWFFVVVGAIHLPGSGSGIDNNLEGTTDIIPIIPHILLQQSHNLPINILLPSALVPDEGIAMQIQFLGIIVPMDIVNYAILRLLLLGDGGRLLLLGLLGRLGVGGLRLGLGILG